MSAVEHPRLRGRERFWRDVDLYLACWSIAREPVAVDSKSQSNQEAKP